MATWYHNIFSRDFGGTDTSSEYVLDPYISGYAYVWVTLPQQIFPNASTTELQFSALCRSLTFNDITLNVVTDDVQGGLKANYPTNLNVIDNLTLTFLADMQGIIVGTIRQWVNAIRDIRLGASNLIGTNYGKQYYSSLIYLIVTQPDGVTPIDGFAFSGCFPKSFPMEVYSFDIAANDKKLITVDFTVDYVYTLQPLLSGNSQDSGISNVFQSNIQSYIQNVKQRLTYSPTQ